MEQLACVLAKSGSGLLTPHCQELLGGHWLARGLVNKVTEEPAVSQCWASVYFTALEKCRNLPESTKLL